MAERQQAEEVVHVAVALADGLQQLRVEELELGLVLRVFGEVERFRALSCVTYGYYMAFYFFLNIWTYYVKLEHIFFFNLTKTKLINLKQKFLFIEIIKTSSTINICYIDLQCHTKNNITSTQSCKIMQYNNKYTNRNNMQLCEVC